MATNNYSAKISQFKSPYNIPGSTTDSVISKGLFLDKKYDQPTYLTFKLMFGYLGDQSYNLVNGALNSGTYDRMPHPLFNTNDKFQSNNTNINRPGVIPSNSTDINLYSTINYLRNANEPTRAEMLKYFIELFNDLQYNNQWYFQSVTGVNELLKVDPKKGIRIDDSKTITIKCLEGLDMRMSYLLNLYKKIVWDDTYQRWVVPDMMRYFTLKIYVTEFRTFHAPYANFEATKEVGPGTNVFLKTIDGFLPTWVITCEQCEIDISEIKNNNLEALNIGNDTLSETSIEFKIKVGQVNEAQIYPMFKNTFLNDVKLNGIYRSREDVDTTGMDQNRNYDIVTDNQIAQGTFANKSVHRAGGYPFNGNLNSNGTTAGDDEELKNTPYKVFNFESERENNKTFIGNLEKTGTAFTKNLAKTAIDKAKMTPIAGISYNEVESAIASKDILGVVDLTKRAITDVLKQTVKPSELLVVEKIISAISPYNIVENLFTEYNSLATNLNSKGTVIPQTIDTDLKSEIKTESNNSTSNATLPSDVPSQNIIIGVPSSQATQNKII